MNDYDLIYDNKTIDDIVLNTETSLLSVDTICLNGDVIWTKKSKNGRLTYISNIGVYTGYMNN